MDRARRFAEASGRDGCCRTRDRPAFLDDDLFEINDFGQPGNVFPDQLVFLDYLKSMGVENGLFFSTGTTVTLDRATGTAEVTHTASESRPGFPSHTSASTSPSTPLVPSPTATSASSRGRPRLMPCCRS